MGDFRSIISAVGITPSGLSDGDKFRLIFLTSTTRNATSSNIGDYNTFVQNRAAAGHMQIRPYSSQFRVVGSTVAVDARDNTGTTGTGVPIYWLNGAKVANNYADFYDGSWSNEANPKKESGANSTNANLRIYTGSNHNGTATSNGSLGRNQVTTGLLDRSDTGPLSSTNRRNATNNQAFYGLSPVFTVKAGPSITDVSVTSRPADGTDTFKAGERVEVTVTFDEAVKVQNAGFNGTNVSLRISLGDTSTYITWQANFLRMDHPRKLVFRLTVTSSHEDDDGLCIGASCGADNIRLSGGGAIVAAEDGVAAVRNYDAVLTSWNVDGSTQGLTGGVCDRHPAVRDAIVAKISAASTCAEVTDAQVNAIGSLDLSGEGIGALRKSDFEGLTSLHTLDLSGNALDHLPADLRENALTGLPAGVFDDLTDLRRLWLSNNALASLPDNVFAPLTKLENGALWITNNPGFADFVPRITVSAPAQTARSGVRVDLEAIVEPNPWGSNLVWSWTRTDTGGETVTLEDDDTRSAYFVAPDVNAETALAFEVTATGRGTAGVSSPSKATEDAAVIRDIDGLPATFDYRWVRIAPGGRQTDIGTNMSRYSPTYSDVGSTIRVEVSFTDLAGYPEGPLASTATAAVPPTTTSGTCPADSDWRATLTLGLESSGSFDIFGFSSGTDFGALDPATITHGSTDYTVAAITRAQTTSGSTITTDNLSITVTGGELPDGTVLNLGGTTLTVDTDSRGTSAGQEQWDLKALSLSPTWVEDQELTVCANLPPGLESAEVEGTSLVLTYTEDLDTRSVPLTGAYSVTVAGTAVPPSSVSVSGKKVTLTLADPVTAGQVVTATYTPGSNPVQDGSGLDALPLTGEEVVIVDETPPIPASAEVPATGNKLTLTFNENLDNGPGKLPPANAFIVTANGVDVPVQSVTAGSGADSLVLDMGEGALVVPTGAVAHHDGVRILVQGIGEVCEKQVHDLGVDARHHQGDVVAGVRAHGGEDVGPLVADLTRPGGTLAPAPPPVTHPALVADARFILKPQL